MIRSQEALHPVSQLNRALATFSLSMACKSFLNTPHTGWHYVPLAAISITLLYGLFYLLRFFSWMEECTPYSIGTSKGVSLINFLPMTLEGLSLWLHSLVKCRGCFALAEPSFYRILITRNVDNTIIGQPICIISVSRVRDTTTTRRVYAWKKECDKYI